MPMMKPNNEPMAAHMKVVKTKDGYTAECPTQPKAGKITAKSQSGAITQMRMKLQDMMAGGKAKSE